MTRPTIPIRFIPPAALATLPFLLLAQTTQPATVDNPFYTAWANQPPGTAVTYKYVVESPQNDHQVLAAEDQVRLLKVTPQNVVVELTTRFPGHDPRSFQITYPAKADKDRELIASMPPEAQATFVLKQVSDGRDSLTIDGKLLDCATRQVSFDKRDPNDDRIFTHTMKYWMAPSLPGGYAKSQTSVEFQGNTLRVTTSTFTAILPAPANPPASQPATRP